MTEYISKSQELNSVIEKLFVVSSESDCAEICNMFDKIYLDEKGRLNNNFRHEYASISGKIRELNSEEVDGEKIYVLDYLLENISNVYDYAVKSNRPYVKNLFKLRDHIGLEAGRISLVEQLRWEISNGQESVSNQLQYMKYATNEMARQIEMSGTVLAQLKEAERENEKNIQTSKVSISKASKLADDIAEKVESVQKDSIAILGIFASIVLSFTAGVVFTSSVLENIDKASPYRLCGIIILIGVVLTNVITVLMMYIDKIRSVKYEKVTFPSPVKWLNIIYCVAFIGNLLLWIIITKPYM